MDEYLSRKIKILSFLSIILVLFLHSSIGGTFSFWTITESKGLVNNIVIFSLSQGATRIAVPLFMLISGYLFFRNVTRGGQIIQKYKTRFKSLVLPYLFWEISWLLIVLIILYLGGKYGIANDSFKSTFFADDITGGKNIFMAIIRPLPVWQLWFLRDLICLVIVSPIIYYLTKYLRLIPLLLVIIILCFVFGKGQTSDICYELFEGCYLNRSSASVLFFMIGSYFAICNKKIVLARCTNFYLPVVFALLWIVTLAARAYFSYQTNGYYLSCVLFQFSVLSGILFVWTGYDVVVKRHDLKQLDGYLPYTFFIYCFHIPIMTYLSIALRFVIMQRIFGIPPQSGLAYTIDYFVTPVIVFFLAVVTARLLIKVAPRLYKISTGGR